MVDTKTGLNGRSILTELREESRLVTPKNPQESFIVSVVDAIKADRILKSSEGGDFEKGYTGLKIQVSNMIRLEKEIEHYVGSNLMFPQSVIYDLRNFILNLFGRIPYTLEELFDLQLKNIRGVNANLTGIIFGSRDELGSLEFYVNNVLSQLKSSVNGRGEKLDTLQRKTKIYSEAQQIFRDIKKTDEDYFEYKKSLKQVRRQVQELKHGYVINNESIIDLGQEEEFLEIIEDLLRTSVHTCERISNKTQHLERHITNTKRVYSQLQKQQSTIVTLTSAVDVLTKSITDVHQILGNGLQNMVEIANSPDILNTFYSTSSDNLGNILSDIEKAYNARDSTIDSFVGAYLN